MVMFMDITNTFVSLIFLVLFAQFAPVSRKIKSAIWDFVIAIFVLAEVIEIINFVIYVVRYIKYY